MIGSGLIINCPSFCLKPKVIYTSALTTSESYRHLMQVNLPLSVILMALLAEQKPQSTNVAPNPNSSPSPQ